jgi:hypothetical protein
MIGCIPDTIGVVTQFQSLANFAGGCYARMPVHGTDVSITFFFFVKYRHCVTLVCLDRDSVCTIWLGSGSWHTASASSAQSFA